MTGNRYYHEHDLKATDLVAQQSEWTVIRRREIVLSYLRALKEQERVLDLGAGFGAYSYYLSNRSQIVISHDICREALTIGERYYNLKFPVIADALNLPYPCETFDLVMMIEVIEHIKDQRRLWNEVRRVLKNRGLLVITTAPIKSDFLYPLIRKMKERNIIGSRVELEELHVCEQHPKQLIINLQNLGFTIIKQRYWDVFHLHSTRKIIKDRFLRNILDKIDESLGYPLICAAMVVIARKCAQYRLSSLF